LIEWLESRLGLRSAWTSATTRLTRPLPAGAGYRVTLGVAAATILLVQCCTGALLALYYTPTLDGAHDSVAVITQELRFGWLARSLHVWGMHLLVGILLLHLLAEFVRGSYRAPREMIWVAGVVLFAVIAAGVFTGQVLPMDQEAYQGLKIAGATAGPLGPLVIGSRDPTDATMMRFFVAHILLIPAAFIGLLVLHALLVGRHRLHGATAETSGDPTFLARCATASLVTIAALAILAFAWPKGLEPKADFTKSIAESKPLWLFLPLYQAKKMGPVEWFVLFGVPLLLVALPFLDRGQSRRLTLIAGFIVITAVAALGVMGATS